MSVFLCHLSDYILAKQESNVHQNFAPLQDDAISIYSTDSSNTIVNSTNMELAATPQNNKTSEEMNLTLENVTKPN